MSETKKPIHLAIFASGSGSNAVNIYRHFEDSEWIRVHTIISNKKDAGVWNRFEKINVDKRVISNIELESDEFIHYLQEIDFIILAGFLAKIPDKLLNTFTDRIINIHPSLLPKYGGKGMYGRHVHQAILLNKETESGITIHLVNEEYDQGRILFQEKIAIGAQETIETLESKIHELEFLYFPQVIEKYISEIAL